MVAINVFFQAFSAQGAPQDLKLCALKCGDSSRQLPEFQVNLKDFVISWFPGQLFLPCALSSADAPLPDHDRLAHENVWTLRYEFGLDRNQIEI